MRLLAIASLTLREAIRRRLLLAVALLTIGVIGLTTWGFAKAYAMMASSGRTQPAEAAATFSVLVVLLAEMFSFVLAVGAAFLAAPAISGDLDSGVALVILPRPIRRAEVVLGKWLGLAALLGTYIVGAGGLELVAIHAVTGYAPPHPMFSLGFIVLQTLVLMTLALALSTRMAAVTAGVIALVLYGVARVAALAGMIAAFYQNDGLMHACTVVSLLVPTGELLRGTAFYLEPVMIAALSGTAGGQNPITVSSPPPPAFLIWTAGWLVAVLAIAVWSFRRRDV
jgi:ABC-type transport system involved in multi-copper enzyme maturation permease subunit